MHLDPWTLALQTINVVVLVWLLARFLFRPVSAIVAARRAAADALIAEAEATRTKAAADAGALAQQRQELASDGERIAAAAHAAAEAERTAIIQQAENAATRLRADAEQAASRKQQTMREALEREAADLAVEIASRLVGRLPVSTLNQAFLQGIAELLATNPVRTSPAGLPVEVRSAAPLDAASQADCRALLSRLVGSVADVSFRTDPTLIAGIELALPEVVIRNSWRADLERVTGALHEDKAHVAAS